MPLVGGDEAHEHLDGRRLARRRSGRGSRRSRRAGPRSETPRSGLDAPPGERLAERLRRARSTRRTTSAGRMLCGHGSSLASLGPRCAVLVELVLDLARADAEHGRRLRRRAAARLERPEDGVPLEVGDGRSRDRRRRRRAPPTGTTLGGRCFFSICGPSHRTTARSTTFSSSRTLPGQRYSSSVASASSANVSIVLPFSAAYRRRKKLASAGMSPRRSRSGGSSTVTTLSR